MGLMTMSKSFIKAMKEMYPIHFLDSNKDQEKFKAEYEEYRQKVFSALGVPKKIIKSNIPGHYFCPKCGDHIVTDKGEWSIPEYFIGDDCMGHRCNCGNVVSGGDLGDWSKVKARIREMGISEERINKVFGESLEAKESKPKARPRRRITIPEEVRLRRAEDGND